MVFLSKEELHVSVYSGRLQVLKILCQKSLYNMFKPRGLDILCMYIFINNIKKTTAY
jgi:hypothetical protein